MARGLERPLKLKGAPTGGRKDKSKGAFQIQGVQAWEGTPYVTSAMQGTRLRRGCPRFKKHKWKIAKEPLIGGQLPSKDRLFGSHPQKDKES